MDIEDKRKIIEEEFLNELYMRIEMLNGQGYEYDKIANLFSKKQIEEYVKLISRNEFKWKRDLLNLFETMSKNFNTDDWNNDLNDDDLKKYCDKLFISIYDLTRELGINDKRPKKINKILVN